MRPDRRAISAAVAATVLVGVTLAAILVFGRITLPSFPALAARPDPRIPGTVVLLRWERDGGCLHAVPAAGGDERELRCERDLGQLVGFGDDGLIELWRHEPTGEQTLLRIHPETGAVVERRSVAPDDDRGPARGLPGSATRADGSRVLTENVDGQARVIVVAPDGDERVVAEVRGPRDYAFWAARWSPDGAWVLVTDSARRLLVAEVSGGRVYLLAEDAGEAIWGLTPAQRSGGHGAPGLDVMRRDHG